ncbi:MAG: hypothetical protein JW967_05710 [Dehalococcoidales bacterium]|nr:hypothetical protein [Dehalococcoidales bacterium]
MGWFYFILIIIMFLVIIIFLPQFLLKRAVRQVVWIFRNNHATSPATAKTLDELNLTQPGFLQRMVSRRDYKPMAIDLMSKEGIIIMLEEDRCYLSEEKLTGSVLSQRAKVPPPGLK